jgi:hypothetical protein
MMHDMKHGYVRLTKRGASLAEQRSALTAVGVSADRIHDDDQRVPKKGKPDPLSGRKQAIHCVRPGDVLVVATAGRLGISREDIREVVKLVAARGGMVQVADGEPFGGPELVALLAFEDAGHKEVERERTVPARLARGTAVTRRISPAQRAALLPMWHDPDKYTVAAIEMVAADMGVNAKRRTLYKLLGNRTESEWNTTTHPRRSG